MGYNATLGGEGSKKLDYNAIIKCYEKEQNATKVAEIIGCHEKSVNNILKSNNISTIDAGKKIVQKQLGKPVCQFTLKGKYLKTYPSTGEAAYILCGNRKKNPHIGECARGERNTAYGFKWKYK
jgi:hypothetical protein